MTNEAIQDTTAASPPSPQLSINSVPPPRRVRSQSIGGAGEFPPPMRRSSTDATGLPRPVPFARKFQRVHPGTTGVTVLEHLERLDAVEQSLQRLGSDETEEMDEEEDVGDASRRGKNVIKPAFSSLQGAASAPAGTSPFSPPGSPPMPTVPEAESARSSLDEEDLVALSKSTSHVEGSSRFKHQVSLSTAGIDWIQSSSETSNKRVVISEVRHCVFIAFNCETDLQQRVETLTKQPLCTCW